MRDAVWPVSADHPGPENWSSCNGIGYDLKGFTRVDATGYHFATLWFAIIGLPILPFGRYYLRESGFDLGANYGVSGQTRTRYDIAGTARLRFSEILRTYAFCWLTPAAAIWPLIALLERADDFPVWVPITAVVVWPTTAIVLAVAALTYYRKKWAPLREVRWVTT